MSAEYSQGLDAKAGALKAAQHLAKVFVGIPWEDMNDVARMDCELAVEGVLHLATPSQRLDAATVERWREALTKLSTCYKDWDPDAKFASSALASAEAVAIAALSPQELSK